MSLRLAAYPATWPVAPGVVLLTLRVSMTAADNRQHPEFPPGPVPAAAQQAQPNSGTCRAWQQGAWLRALPHHRPWGAHTGAVSTTLASLPDLRLFQPPNFLGDAQIYIGFPFNLQHLDKPRVDSSPVDSFDLHQITTNNNTNT